MPRHQLKLSYTEASCMGFTETLTKSTLPSTYEDWHRNPLSIYGDTKAAGFLQYPTGGIRLGCLNLKEKNLSAIIGAINF